jgi:hypothetical protein
MPNREANSGGLEKGAVIQGKVIIRGEAKLTSGEYAVFLGKPIEAIVAEEAIKRGYKVGQTVRYIVIIEPPANFQQV